MNRTNPSASAEIIAAHRAMESLKPSDVRICYDPFAEKLISPAATVIGESQLPRDQALDIFKQFVPGFHEYFLARTRYIDDFLTASLDRDLAQLVILGAGYDSRAYRFESLKAGVRVFEVDHPATQAVKKERLLQILDAPPSHVTFVELDFHQGNIGERLMQNGYDTTLKTLFIWEGVTMYLDPEIVDQVLGFVSGHSGPGSTVIFDVTTPDVVQGRDLRTEAAAWRQKTADSGEPLRFGIGFDEIDGFLKQRRFTKIKTITHRYFNQAYFNGAEDHRAATPILAIAQGTRSP